MAGIECKGDCGYAKNVGSGIQVSVARARTSSLLLRIYLDDAILGGLSENVTPRHTFGTMGRHTASFLLNLWCR